MPVVRARSASRELSLRAEVMGSELRESLAPEVVRSWTVEEFFGDPAPPTEDDVPIALDGRVLGTPAKLIAYLEEKRCTSG